MILSIRTIKDVGIFKDFKWDRINNNLREFKKVNLIYGWNASGKTTLSRIFACLEKGHPGKLKLSENSECILEFWDHNQKSYVSIGSKNIPESLSNKVRVFNEDFVEENIEWTSGKLGKILMIGQQSIQLKADLKSLEEKIEKQKEIVDKIEKQIKNVENEMSDLLSKAAKEVRDEFRKVKNIRPLSGRAKDYINYNSQDAEKILAEFSKTKDKYNNEDLIRKWKLTLEEKHPKAEIKPLQIEELLKPIRELIQKTKNILETEIPETTIEISLNSKKLDKSVREWLLRGYQLHKNLNEPKVCLFCKNEISNKRWQQIENSFAKEVEDFYHKLDNIERQISKFIPPTLNLQKDEFYLEHHTEYLNLHQRLSDATNTLSKLINSLSDK
ncbi:AAA family ATPase, partial [Fervidobacterium sp.]